MGVRADQAVKKYLDRIQSGSAKEAYRNGIDAVTENPMQKAADADDLYLARVEESVRSGRRRNALLSVPMTRWKENAKTKGAERLASGAVAAADKVRSHFQKWAPIYDQASEAVKSMPKGTREDAKARVGRVIDILMDAAGRQ